jgi:hypothetical protein
VPDTGIPRLIDALRTDEGFGGNRQAHQQESGLVVFALQQRGICPDRGESNRGLRLRFPYADNHGDIGDILGKRKEADKIAKFVGGLGSVRDSDGELISPPPEWFVHKAAKILGCSFLELESHSDKARLMTLAFTFEQGEGQGEYLKELNPEWQRKKKEVSDKINKASR